MKRATDYGYEIRPFYRPGDVKGLDYDRDLAYAEERLAYLPAVSRDLSAFRKRGNKLLMYAGWMDPAGRRA